MYKVYEKNDVMHDSEISLILFGHWPFQVATGMVAGTFLAAPLMFVSARMLSVVVVSEMDYKDLLLKTSFDASIISMVACVSDATILSNHHDFSGKERFSLTFNQMNVLYTNFYLHMRKFLQGSWFCRFKFKNLSVWLTPRLSYKKFIWNSM